MASAREPRTLQQAILFFADYANCRKAVQAIRWPDGVVRCPNCGSDHVTYLENARLWKCYARHPRAKFSLKVGTIFEDSPIPLQKWLPALWLLTNCRNGISSYELARALDVTQKTAWFMLSRLRLALQREDGGKLGGEVEVDETYIGGKARNMSVARRRRYGISQGTSMAGKVAIMGLLDRHWKDGTSQMRPAVVAGRRRHHFRPIIDQHLSAGATIRPSHLFRYLEQAFRFDNCVTDDAARLALALRDIINRRLTYVALTGSELPQTC